MSQRPIAEVRTWLYLIRAVTKIERRLAAQLERYDLTPAQFEVLLQLHRTPHILQQQLATQVIPEHEALVAEYLGVLTPEDRGSLHDVLRRLNHALGPE